MALGQVCKLQAGSCGVQFHRVGSQLRRLRRRLDDSQVSAESPSPQAHRRIQRTFFLGGEFLVEGT